MTAQRAKQVTEALLRYVNRSHWKVRIASMKDYDGLCVYRDKEVRLDVLHVLADPDAQVLDTVAHEVAHVIMSNDSHGDLWRETYEELRDWLLEGRQCEWLGEIPEYIATLIAQSGM